MGMVYLRVEQGVEHGRGAQGLDRRRVHARSFGKCSLSRIVIAALQTFEGIFDTMAQPGSRFTRIVCLLVKIVAMLHHRLELPCQQKRLVDGDVFFLSRKKPAEEEDVVGRACQAQRRGDKDHADRQVICGLGPYRIE